MSIDSTPGNDSSSSEESDEDSEEPDRSEMPSDNYQTKLEAHHRDGFRCLNCRKRFDEEARQLDADHIVPQGAGGCSIHTNISSLCRECHEAKHGEREIAPTIRWMSTGEMSPLEFRWFRHFWDEIFPVLTEIAIGQRVDPLIDIDEGTPWQARHIPLGVLRFCDEKFANRDDVNYAPKEAHHYM